MSNGGTENAGLEKSGLENAGTSCAWVAKCDIINVRVHVKVNVTAEWGGPAYTAGGNSKRQLKLTRSNSAGRSPGNYRCGAQITAATTRQLHAEIHPEARRVNYSLLCHIFMSQTKRCSPTNSVTHWLYKAERAQSKPFVHFADCVAA